MHVTLATTSVGPSAFPTGDEPVRKEPLRPPRFWIFMRVTKKTGKGICFLLFCLLTSSSLPLLSDFNFLAMPYYFSAQIRIENHKEYDKYLENFDDIFSRYKGEYLAIDESPTLLEGEWDYTKSVLVKFNRRQDFESWYYSKDYQEILKYRLNAAKCDSILIKGLD